MKMKTWLKNMPHHKKTQKAIIILIISLPLMILLPNLFHEMPEKFLHTNLSLTDNPPKENQPINTLPTPTGCHPLKNSPASTNISNKV
uniref:FORF n=1 Tax=Potamilus alatus TaxID=81573 RepID=A0A1Q2HLR7_9BIVA|nr:FORF [Potamilus alatus]